MVNEPNTDSSDDRLVVVKMTILCSNVLYTLLMGSHIL